MPLRACVGHSLRRLAAGLPIAAACAGLAGYAYAGVSLDDQGGPQVTAAAAQAAAPPMASYSAPSPAPATSRWEVSAVPYLWMAGLKGDVAVSPSVPPVSVDASFGDIWDALNFAGMAALEVRRDRFVTTADVIYIDLETSKNIGIRDPGFVNANLGSKMLISTVEAGYRVVDQGPFFVDLFGGARIVKQDVDLKLSGPNRAVEGSKSETWADPVVAARVLGPLGGKWSYTAYGDVGGFGVSSSLTWQLLGAVQYQASRAWTLSAGWRHLDIDYRNNGFVFDAAMDGPILGASYRF